MYRHLEDFLQDWKDEAGITQNVLAALTDGSLGQQISPADRTLGRIAWHLVTTLSEMMGKVGIAVRGPAHDSAPPVSASKIAETYAVAAKSVVDELQTKWTDATLQVEDEMYGEKWTRGVTLMALLVHQVHHRGQMTVLMRQTGLKPPSIYGPTREEWAVLGMQPPAV